jgi:alpha-galactosidase
MEGMGEIAGDPNRAGGIGSLRYLVDDPETAARSAHLRDADGKWAARSDVRVWFRGNVLDLGLGSGATPGTFGPELQFGHFVGDAYDEPVLIAKIAWGGKSLYRDFRPPSSGLPAAAVLERLTARDRKRHPNRTAAQFEASFGDYYRRMIAMAIDVETNAGRYLPSSEDARYELAGFAWHQGWTDGAQAFSANEYEANLANLIRDVRRDLGSPELPVVIANSGFGGWENQSSLRRSVAEAPIALAKRPEFRDNIAVVETRGLYRTPEQSPASAPMHWNHNAETVFLMGDAMGKAMWTLLQPAAGTVQ